MINDIDWKICIHGYTFERYFKNIDIFIYKQRIDNTSPVKYGGEYINYPLSIKIYLVLRGFKAILLMMRFQCFFVVFRYFVPVNNAEKFLDIVWATVLVVQIVCMFPNVQT